MNRLPFLTNLNGLRFLAASYVIGFHYFSFPGLNTLNLFFGRGHIAVPFFFLLSGFILFYNYQNTNFKIFNYFKSRFIRLAPIYYLAMVAAIPLLYKNIQRSDFTVFESVYYFFSHLTLTQALFINKDLLSFWNIHSWSLSVEMFLYICSPFAIIKTRKLNLQTSIVTLAFLVTLNSLIYLSSFFSSLTHIFLQTHFAPLYLFTFVSGCLLARIYMLTFKKVERFSKVLFLSSLIILSLSFSIELPKSFYSTFNPFYQLFFCFLILGSCHKHTLNKWLGIPFLIILGDASYAMYIFQAPVKLLVQQILYKILDYPVNTGFIYSLTVYVSIIIVSVVVSRSLDPILRKKLRRHFLKN